MRRQVISGLSIVATFLRCSETRPAYTQFQDVGQAQSSGIGDADPVRLGRARSGG
jgi:hypothetical protein